MSEIQKKIIPNITKIAILTKGVIRSERQMCKALKEANELGKCEN